MTRDEKNRLPPIKVTAALPPEHDLFKSFAMTFGLSSKQCEVLQPLLDARTNQQTASKLVITNDTAKYHVRNVLKKTGCKNRSELQAA